MTGRLRMAVAAALATALTASSLLPLVHRGEWVAQALGAIVMVAVTGEVARRLSVPRPFIGTIQLVMLIPYLLLVLVPDASGPLPTPDALRAYGDLLGTGGDDIQSFAPPVPATDGIGAILVTVVAGVAVLVDVIAVTYAQAAPAGLPLLALYSVPAALAESGLGWTVFLLSGLAYVILLLAEGRERLLRWGRPLVPPGAHGHGSGRPRPWARGGGRIGLATLAVAVLVPAVVPMTANRLADKEPKGGSDRITTINPVVNLQNELNRPENVDLLTYTTDSDEPVYLRLAALDLFDGNSWQPSEQSLSDVSRPLPGPQGLAENVRIATVKTTVKAEKNYQQGSLPMPYAASEVQVKGNWRYEHEGRLLLGDDDQNVSGLRWTVTSLDVRPSLEQFRMAGPPPPNMGRYRTVPPQLMKSLKATTERLALEAENTGTYGKTLYDKARYIQNWFLGTAGAGGFSYSTKIPNSGNGASAIENFMQQRVGYCEQFASAMAVMARILGIPARVAVGFVPGTPSGADTFRVGSHDAHAWPELYFTGIGWVRFEPTPSRGGAPSYADTAPVPEQTTLAPTSEPSETATEPTSEASASCQLGTCASESPSAAAAPSGGDDNGRLNTVLVGVGVAAAVLLLLAAPMLLRRRTRRRRLAALSRDAAADGVPREPGDAVIGAWNEVLDTARDLGIRTETSETPRQLTARLLDLMAVDADTAREGLPRIALAAEQVMYAPEAPQRTIGLAEDVRAVRTALLASATRGVRVRATVLPSSTFRRRDGGPLERLHSGPDPEPAPGEA